MLKINGIPTGVPGLDSILNGGLPELSFNLISGEPGSGKTTLAHQIVFANATPEKPALYFTIVGESPFKMLRYQQQFGFFDMERVGKAVHYHDLSDAADAGDIDRVLSHIAQEIEKVEPAFVVVDSFRTLVRAGMVPSESNAGRLQGFMQRLANQLTRWEATTFLVGEFPDNDRLVNPVFTVADGIIWLRQVRAGDSVVRKLQVVKMRGKAQLPGLHTFRITDHGLRTFPRLAEPLPDDATSPTATGTATAKAGVSRRSTGVAGLDEMTQGGIPAGESVVLTGPSGSGKSLVGMHFTQAGLDAGEKVVLMTFEEEPDRYRQRAFQIGLDLARAEAEGLTRMIHRRPLDLSVDETFEEIRDAVIEIGASRVVIDSLSGLEIAAQGNVSMELRDTLFRMVEVLKRGGVTILMTSEIAQKQGSLSFTPHQISFLADIVILQRYVEIRGQLEKVMTVAKMRTSAHSRSFHRYWIRSEGLVVGKPLRRFSGIITGVPQLVGEEARPIDEEDLQSALSHRGEATIGELAEAAGVELVRAREILGNLREAGIVELAEGEEEDAEKASTKYRLVRPTD